MINKLVILVILLISRVSLAGEKCWIFGKTCSDLPVTVVSLTVTTNSYEECFDQALKQAKLQTTGPDSIERGPGFYELRPSDRHLELIYTWIYDDGLFSMDTKGYVTALSEKICPTPRAGNCVVHNPKLLCDR